MEHSEESQKSLPIKAEPILPPCAGWGVWLGEEIEGHSDLGVKTLFVRRLNPTRPIDFYYQWAREGVRRIWFTIEFKDWEAVRKLMRVYRYACFEVGRSNINALPLDIRMNARLYYKLPLQLKPGDHICVGSAFNDESFVIGKGNKVEPAYYSSDVFIE